MQLTFYRRCNLKAIAPVILAAGDSIRMGYPKALLPIGNGTFISRILETLARVELPEPFIVLGREVAHIAPQIPHQRARILVNPDPGRGQISSIQLALTALAPHHAACLFWPVDQPSVTETVIRELIQLFCDSGALIALPFCGGKRGHPAIFHRALFQELLTAPLEEGPKRIVAGHAQETVLLPCDELSTVEDIDTPEDYLNLTGETLDEALRRTVATRLDS